MLLRQINANKCRLANDAICKLMRENIHCIYLITEPYITKYGKIPGLPRNYSFYGTSSSRAIIIAPTIMPLFMCHELSSKDYTVCLYDDGTSKMFFCSVYLDQVIREVVSQQMTKIMDFFEAEKVQAILSLDTNAHSVFWNCDETDSRGSQLEEFVITHDLHVLNVGHTPTFQPARYDSASGRYGTIIDVTLLLGDRRKVQNWHVKNENFHSDHKMIEMSLVDKKISDPVVQKVDWNNFLSHLEADLQDLSYNLWCPDIVEKEAKALAAAITNALNKSSFSTPQRPKSARWWSNELQQKWTKVNSLWRESVQRPTDVAKDNYKAAKKALVKDLRRAKRQKWKEFCESIEDPKSMALFNKVLNSSPYQKVGLLKQSDGTFTRSVKDSINLLMNEHFPDSVNVPLKGHKKRTSTYNLQNGNFCSRDDLKWSYITEDKVSLAINSFGCFKASGLDGFKPIHLKYFIKNKIALKRLTMLFRAIVELGYTPNSWCEAKIIFIPKPGKKDYSEVRSFRPISLLSFLLKSIERLAYWEIIEDSGDALISKNQHAFRKNYSTETALSVLVDNIEDCITRSNYALICNLDIQGAFDNALYSTILDSMVKNNIKPKLVKWFEQFLYSRTAKIDFSGTCAKYLLKRGCPQGGVLSPFIWNLNFESFIKTLDKGPINVLCFADDSALYIKGVDPPMMVILMQDAINAAVEWGNKHGLKFVPSKTEAIFFYGSYNRKYKEPTKLKVDGVPITYSKSVKFLGLTLDHHLNWNQHIENKINKSRALFMKIRNAIGSLWGPSPRALKWAINGIVIPTLTYGSVVWAHRAVQKYTPKLRKLNRLLALSLMPVRKSTPTQGLEVILYQKPIHISIEELALNAMLRVMPHVNPKHGEKPYFGHVQWGMKKLHQIGISETEFDKTDSLNLSRNFEVDLDSLKSGIPVRNNDTLCFTDGSKLQNHAGYGWIVTKGLMEEACDNGYLGTAQTVFQAEITAIKECCEYLLLGHYKNVTIFSDSQAAILALLSPRIRQKSVKNCIDKLNELAISSKVTIKWVKAHADHTGNEIADEQAKLGTTNKANKVVVYPPISWAKAKIAEACNNQWESEWVHYEEARQTKFWFHRPNKRNSNSLIRLPRIELGLAVQMITGHNRLRYHQSKIDPEGIDPTCRWCLGPDETSWHIIGDCERFLDKRLNAFGVEDLMHNLDWKVDQFLHFMRNAKLKKLNRGEDEDDVVEVDTQHH